MKFTSVISAVILLAFSPFVLAAQASEPKLDDPATGKKPAKVVRTFHAVRNNERIEIAPPGISFRIPDEWLEWHKQNKNNLHLTDEELEAVKRPDLGDWDPEYASVVNAVLPFERCVLHAGGEGWGRDSVSYADIQMRVYVVDDSPKKIESKVTAEGVQAVRALFTPKLIAKRNGRAASDADNPPKDMQVPVARNNRRGWQQVALTYQLQYGDYSADANVDFRLRRIGEQTVAVVFMHTNFKLKNQIATIEKTLESFELPKNLR